MTQIALYDAALDAAPTALLVVDEAGAIAFANRRALEVFGYGREELEGRPIELLVPKRWHEPHVKQRDRYHADVSHRRRGNRPLTGLRKDGTEFPAEIGLAPWETDGAKYVIAAVQDVTSRLQLEEQLRHAQKMEAIGRLAGGLAHDFNNLLTAMNGYADLIISGLPADDPMRADAQEIRNAGQRASDLTRQLLALGRRQVLAPRVVDLNDLVADLDRMLPRLLGEDIVYRTVTAPEPCPVLVDPGQIEQVILNLVVNARDATSKGGAITVETALTVREDVLDDDRTPLAPGRYAMLAVSDTGEGMDAATRAHIFEPFFTTKPAGKGSGLGLATVYGIVAQSGGTVWVYSEPGRGSTFKVYLPFADEPAAGRTEPPAGASPRGHETILLVEDEAVVRTLVADVLRRAGYSILEAGDVTEATELAGRYAGKIDLLVTDVVMPGENGPDMARRLVESRPGMRVLFVSGYTNEGIGDHGVASEAAFLPKPFSPAALARKVRETLDSPSPEERGEAD